MIAEKRREAASLVRIRAVWGVAGPVISYFVMISRA